MVKILLLLMTGSLLAADEFTLTPTDPDVDLSSLPKEIKIRAAAPKIKKRYLSVKERDVVLEKYLKTSIKGMDEFDRDILYKSVISYDAATLIKKYPFLRQINLNELKHALH